MLGDAVEIARDVSFLSPENHQSCKIINTVFRFGDCLVQGLGFMVLGLEFRVSFFLAVPLF